MYFNTILDAVASYSEKTPEKICLIDSDNKNEITYKDFWFAALSFSEELQRNGLQKGDRVVVRVGKIIETSIAQFGINIAGGVYCPVEKQIKELKILEMMDYFDSNFVISTEHLDFNGVWYNLSGLSDYSKESYNKIKMELPNENDLCTIIFTTGTTGKAKGVMLNYKALAVFSDIRMNVLGITEKDTMLWTTPLDRVGGMRASFIAFITGATAVYCDGIIFLNDFYKAIEKYNVTALYLNSFTAVIILKNAPEKLTKYSEQIRVTSFGGGFMPEKYKNLAMQYLPKTRLVIFYGSAEVSTISSFEYNNNIGKVNCVGKPHPGTKVYFLNDSLTNIINTSKDAFGIVACESLCSMQGYWKDDELTEHTIKNGRILMTDVGYSDNDGYIYLIGRRDDVIVSGGYKIAPYEIEDIALQIPFISECICISSPNDTLGAIPKLFVMMHSGSEFSSKDIYDYLSERLETYKLPRIIREIESFPRIGSSQKIDRKALRIYD